MNRAAIVPSYCIPLLTIWTAAAGRGATQPPGTTSAAELVVISLTEPLPGSPALADPVIAADWPEPRRARAAKILFGSMPVDLDGLRACLRARAASPQGLPPAVRVEVAANRRWEDVRAVVRLCGEPEISLRALSVAVAGIEAPPADTVELYMSDSLPGSAALADPVIAADWPAGRRKRAAKTFHAGQPVTTNELRGVLRAAVVDPAYPQIHDRRRDLLLRIEVAATRAWADVLAVLGLCGEAAIDIRRLEIVPVTWEHRAEDVILPPGPRIKLTDDGRFGVEWEWSDGSLKIVEVGEGGCMDAGIRAGDRFVAVDGEQLDGDAEMRDVRDEVAAGKRAYALLDVRRGSKQLRFVLTK